MGKRGVKSYKGKHLYLSTRRKKRRAPEGLKRYKELSRQAQEAAAEAARASTSSHQDDDPQINKGSSAEESTSQENGDQAVLTTGSIEDQGKGKVVEEDTQEHTSCDDSSTVQPQTADSSKVVTREPDSTDDVTQSVNMEQSKDVEMTSLDQEENENFESRADEIDDHADLSKLCRMCAKKINGNPVTILGPKPNLADQLFRYLKVKITETDGLPTHICFTCRCKLIDWMKVDIMVQDSLRIFTTHLRKRRHNIFEPNPEPLRPNKKIILNKTDHVKTYSKRERFAPNILTKANRNQSRLENCNSNNKNCSSNNAVESDELIHEPEIVTLETVRTEEDIENIPVEDCDPLLIESEIPEIVSDNSFVSNLKFSMSNILSNNSGEKSMEINVNKPSNVQINVNSNSSKENSVITMNYESNNNNNMELPKLTPAPHLIQNKNLNVNSTELNPTEISSNVNSSPSNKKTQYILIALNSEQISSIINSQETVPVSKITDPSVSQGSSNNSTIQNVNRPPSQGNIQVKPLSSLMEPEDNNSNNVELSENVELEENTIKITDVRSLSTENQIDNSESLSEKSVQVQNSVMSPPISIHNSSQSPIQASNVINSQNLVQNVVPKRSRKPRTKNGDEKRKYVRKKIISKEDSNVKITEKSPSSCTNEISNISQSTENLSQNNNVQISQNSNTPIQNTIQPPTVENITQYSHTNLNAIFNNVRSSNRHTENQPRIQVNCSDFVTQILPYMCTSNYRCHLSLFFNSSCFQLYLNSISPSDRLVILGLLRSFQFPVPIQNLNERPEISENPKTPNLNSISNPNIPSPIPENQNNNLRPISNTGCPNNVQGSQNSQSNQTAQKPISQSNQPQSSQPRPSSNPDQQNSRPSPIMNYPNQQFFGMHPSQHPNSRPNYNPQTQNSAPMPTSALQNPYPQNILPTMPSLIPLIQNVMSCVNNMSQSQPPNVPHNPNLMQVQVQQTQNQPNSVLQSQHQIPNTIPPQIQQLQNHISQSPTVFQSQPSNPKLTQNIQNSYLVQNQQPQNSVPPQNINPRPTQTLQNSYPVQSQQPQNSVPPQNTNPRPTPIHQNLPIQTQIQQGQNPIPIPNNTPQQQQHPNSLQNSNQPKNSTSQPNSIPQSSKPSHIPLNSNPVQSENSNPQHNVFPQFHPSYLRPSFIPQNPSHMQPQNLHPHHNFFLQSQPPNPRPTQIPQNPNPIQSQSQQNIPQHNPTPPHSNPNISQNPMYMPNYPPSYPTYMPNTPIQHHPNINSLLNAYSPSMYRNNLLPPNYMHPYTPNYGHPVHQSYQPRPQIVPNYNPNLGPNQGVHNYGPNPQTMQPRVDPAQIARNNSNSSEPRATAVPTDAADKNEVKGETSTVNNNTK